MSAALFDQQAQIDDSEYYDNLITGASDFAESWSSAGNVIVDTFGTIGQQLDKLGKQNEEFAQQQKKIAQDRLKYADDPKMLGKLANAEESLAKTRTSAHLSSYASITSGAANMFDEESKGRETLMLMSNIFTAAEIANSLIRGGAYAVEAVTAAFAAPWPIGFASGAAMLAIVAGLGFAVSGGSGSAPESAESRQASQGTGTVFGDSDAKSESLLNAYERVEDLQLDQYAVLQEMNAELRSLNTNITHLAASLVGAYGKFDERSYTGELGDKSTTSKFEGALVGIADLDPTGLVGGIISGFSKTKKSLVDSGISIVGQTFGDIIDGATLDVQAYYDVKTKKSSFWGLKSKNSYSREYQDVGSDIDKEFSLIFQNIGSSINQAVDVLGVDVGTYLTGFQEKATADMANYVLSNPGGGEGEMRQAWANILDNAKKALGEETARSLDNYRINLPEMSFKDMTGEEIEKALSAMLSAEADKMAQYLAPTIGVYQQVGEGYYNTLVRVAQEQAVFNSAMDAIGHNLNDIGITSKQVQTEIAQSIIGLMGGLDNFREYTSTYFSEFFTDEEQFEFLEKNLNEMFAGLEQTLPGTREEFKTLLGTFDKTTESGAALYASMLSMVGSLDQYYDTLEDNAETVEESISAEDRLAQARAEAAAQAEFLADIQDQLARLDMSPLQIQLLNLQNEFDGYRDEAAALGVETGLLETLYSKERQTIIDNALSVVNADHERQMRTLTADHESKMNTLTTNHEQSVNDLVANNERFVSSLQSINAAVNSNILSLKRNMSGWNEVDYQQGNVSELRGQLSTGDVDARLTTVGKLNEAIWAKYNAEIDHNNSLADLANERHQNDISRYNDLLNLANELKSAATSLKLGNLSPLSKTEQFNLAKAEFQRAQSTGDTAGLRSAGENYINQANGFFGGTASREYGAIFEQVTSAFGGVNVGSEPPVPSIIKKYQSDNLALGQDTLLELEKLQALTAELEAEQQLIFEENLIAIDNNLILQTEILTASLSEQTSAITSSINGLSTAISNIPAPIINVPAPVYIPEIQNPSNTASTAVIKEDKNAAVTAEQITKLVAINDKQLKVSKEQNDRFEALEIRLAESNSQNTRRRA